MANKKEEKSLEKSDVLDYLDNIRFYIGTKKQAGEALIFTKKLKKFSEMVEKKVKDRAWEIMSEENINEIETEGFLIKKMEATELRTYNPENVIEGIGLELAKPFISVSSGKLEEFLKKGNAKGDISFDQMGKCQEGITTKPRKGHIKINEVKEKKDE